MMRRRMPKIKSSSVFLAVILISSYGLFMLLMLNHVKSSNDDNQQQLVDSQSNALLSAPGLSSFHQPQVILSSNDYSAPFNDSTQQQVVVSDGSSSTPLDLNESKSTSESVFISVKTSGKFHLTRLDLIIKTWYLLDPDQIWFFTDSDDPFYQQKSNGHLINTNCSSSHSRKALCCKMSVELDMFLSSDKKWFCHFDDDNYVNVPRLMDLLQSYDPTEDWYLGKPSIRAPLQIMDRKSNQKIGFWFATGGAGFCLSRSLVLKMKPIVAGGNFISVGEKIRLPDDVTIGYIIEYMLRKPLTVIEQFHSHLEPMKHISESRMNEQISFSYSHSPQSTEISDMNTVHLPHTGSSSSGESPYFDPRVDPTRFLSLHCHLFPNFNYCPKKHHLNNHKR